MIIKRFTTSKFTCICGKRLIQQRALFDVLRIEPLLKGEGIFKQKGRLLVWVTDDEYKIPVQMTSEVAVGSHYDRIGKNRRHKTQFTIIDFRMSKYQKLDFKNVQTYSLKDRKSKVSLSDFAKPVEKKPDD